MRLFSRRHAPSPPTATESVASSTSNRDSTDGDYVLPDKPVYTMSASAASKLRLPFRRKVPQPQPDPRQADTSLDGAHPRIASVMSDSGHGLPPPPRKSSLFGVYNQSVHSLPNDPSSHVHSDTPARPSSSEIRTVPPVAQPHKKSPSLFPWARERTKSRPPQPVSSAPSSTLSVEDPLSFNLRSFRHVRPDSPSTTPEQSPQPLSDSLLVPPRPRPRGDSVASDSSQRISVAAFREAHARSRANSPVPSFRPPSTAETLRVDVSRNRASTVSAVSGADRPQPNKNAFAAPVPSLRPNSSAPDSSSDESDSEEGEDVDSDGEPIPKPVQKHPVARRANRSPERTDAGLGSASAPTVPHLAPRPSQSHQAPSNRKRTSVSTSALTPNTAARKASILAGTNSSSSSHAQLRHPPHKPNDETDESSDSLDTASEDLPLSGLVAPRRPGSSASNNSNNRPRVPPKPLIDISTLAGGPPLLTPILRHENSVKKFHKKDREPDIEKDQPFSVPAVLALSASPSPPVSPSMPQSASRPPSTVHNRRPSGDVPTLPQPKESDNDDLINAIRLVGALDKELDQPSVKPSLDRIIPTPIRQREPPTSFTVLSRPPHRQSFAETSVSLSPTSPTQPSISPTLSQPNLGARQRASTMVSSSPQKDKSDTVSITSVARSSASRTSRIPPVPLIHSIPNSPSVKEDNKPGRPRSASGTSAISTLQRRSHPPRTTPVPPLPSSTQSKAPPRGFQTSSMPQRPFASNSSIQGESPAGSSTGDSSSGRAPFTPRDGSDIGMRSKEDASDQGSTLKARGHAKKHSVTFEDQPLRGRERAQTDVTNEQRTRERRRSEAKAALELGKIVNGRRPLNDDPDEDVGLRSRNPTINVTMENGAQGMMQPNWPAWQQPMSTGMSSMFPSQFNNDSAYLVAHQRALLIAKQAYQMAVAQHAMQVAGEEWERSSNAGFGSGSSVYGGGSGGSVYGGGSGVSAYGGSGSFYGGGMGPMGMMGMPNMGMLIPPNPWAARSSIAFPSTASVYGGISSSQSEYGGTEGWGTQSVYGNSFGPSSSRTSLVAPNSSASTYGGGARPRASTTSQPAKVIGKGAARSRAAPPSSWKSGR